MNFGLETPKTWHSFCTPSTNVAFRVGDLTAIIFVTRDRQLQNGIGNNKWTPRHFHNLMNLLHKLLKILPFYPPEFCVLLLSQPTHVESTNSSQPSLSHPLGDLGTHSIYSLLESPSSTSYSS